MAAQKIVTFVLRTRNCLATFLPVQCPQTGPAVGLASCMQIRIQSIQVPEGLVQDFMYASCMLCMLEKMGTFKGGGGLRAGRTAAPDSGARAPGCLSQMRGSWFNAKKERKQKQAWCAIGPPAAAEAPASFSGLRCDQSTWNYPLAMPWAAATAAALTAADIALDESRGGAEGHTKHTRRKAQKVVILYAACMLLYALVCTGIFSIQNDSPSRGADS